MEENNNICTGGSILIFSCSGAVDVGEIADRVARKLTQDGVGAMFCLAGIGGEIEPIIKKTKTAQKILAIDGCGLDCVKYCLKKKNFTNFQHLRLTDIGLEKGKSPSDEQKIADVAEKAKQLLV